MFPKIFEDYGLDGKVLALNYEWVRVRKLRVFGRVSSEIIIKMLSFLEDGTIKLKP